MNCKNLFTGNVKRVHEEGGSIAQWLEFVLPDSAALDLIPAIPKKILEKKLPMLPRIIDGAAAYSSGQQRLNNVNQSNLVQASGKLVIFHKE